MLSHHTHALKVRKMVLIFLLRLLFCFQINVDEDVGEINKVRVGFIDTSKLQRWHLRKVGGKCSC